MMTSRLIPETIRRVLPVMQIRESGGGRVTCTAAEFYEDAAYLDFWVEPPPRPRQPALPMLGIKATDDQGTPYTVSGGGGTGTGPGYRWRMSYIVRPAVPDNAEWLELFVRFGHLPEQDGRVSGGRIEFDEEIEPVTFRISLSGS